jgi:hypothetical protein
MGAIEVFEGMNEQLVALGDTTKILKIFERENHWWIGQHGHHHGEYQKSMMCPYLHNLGREWKA